VSVDRDTPALDALRSADIPPERQGAARTRRLTAAQRELYVWILREFAASRSPSGEATGAAATGLGIDPVEALAVLAREDLVHVDANGRPLVAYPFSAKQRGHRVLIDGKRWVEAMCAIDALGIAPMLGVAIEIHSRDPVSAGEVWVRLDPGDGAWWEPQEAVVLAGSARCDGPSYCGCCDVLNFFETRENAERYLAEHSEIGGHPISLPEAIEAGRIVFGDVFERGGLMPRPIDRDEVQRLLAEGAQLVEVLPQAEFEEEHLPGAINIPLKTLDAETVRRLERERPVIVYCHDYQ
jgi:hypothetical protein